MTRLAVRGYALVLGDNVDTDTIIAAKYLHYTEPEKLAEGVFANAPSIKRRLESLRKPVVIVSGQGFGYGSSREHAAIALKAAGVKAIVALSFHRIFYRNAINNGLLVVEALEDPRDKIREGDLVTVKPEEGVVESPHGIVKTRRLPEAVVKLLERGGLRGELSIIAREGIKARG